MLFPAPGAPTTTVSGTCAPVSSVSCRRWRGTCQLGSAGGENFVAARSRGVRIPFLLLVSHPHLGDGRSPRRTAYSAQRLQVIAWKKRSSSHRIHTSKRAAVTAS